MECCWKRLTLWASLDARHHINLTREKAHPLVRVLGPGRWRPESVRARDGVSEGLRDWQKPAGGRGGREHHRSGEGRAGQLDDSAAQLGGELRLQVRVSQTSAIPLLPSRIWGPDKAVCLIAFFKSTLVLLFFFYLNVLVFTKKCYIVPINGKPASHYYK